MNKWIYRALIIFFVVIIFLFEFFFELKDNDFYAYFLDVGQGDSTLIRTPEGLYILIDTGRGTLSIEELSRYFPVSNNKIDILIISHFDIDHVGAIGEIIRTFNVKNVIYNELDNDHYKYTDYFTNINILSTDDIKLGCCVSLDFIDTGYTGDDDNSKSLAVKVSYKDFDMFFGGDIPSSIENSIAGEIGDIELLKVSHHGSRESTSLDFLKKVKPEYSVISVGESNSYGHPHIEVINNLNEIGSKLLRTDQNGTQVIFIDEFRIGFYSSSKCVHFCNLRLYFSKFMN